MKKFLFLLGLLYLISCETVKLCEDDSDDKEPSKSDCFKRELADDDKELKAKCCYVKGKITVDGKAQSGASCSALPPELQKKDKLAQQIKDAYKEMGMDAKVEINELSCYGSYLRFGMLLLSLLLL